MNEILLIIIKIIAALVVVPFIGGILSGLDRKVSAKMQKRKGPPLLQPFYDVIKLLQKEATTVSFSTRFFITLCMCFSIFTVLLFILGADLLLCIFAFTLGCIFFVIAGYSSYSPYSFIGTERELIQIMCYEPMILMTAFGFYEAVGSFNVYDVFYLEAPIIVQLPFIFLGLLYVLTIKLRKSPFDLSMSHHGHQEIVKGITTELTGVCLAMVEITHWFETIFALGLVYLFFVYSSSVSWIVAVVLCFFIFLFEVAIDNAFARTKWKRAIQVSWIVTGLAAGINFLILNLLKGMWLS